MLECREYGNSPPQLHQQPRLYHQCHRQEKDIPLPVVVSLITLTGGNSCGAIYPINRKSICYKLVFSTALTCSSDLLRCVHEFRYPREFTILGKRDQPRGAVRTKELQEPALLLFILTTFKQLYYIPAVLLFIQDGY